MANMRVACVVALMCMVVVSAPIAEAAISCGNINGALVSCITYLKGGPGPSAQCCNGVKKVKAAAATKPDRQAVCNCLKSAAGSVSGLNTGNAASLPGKCGVSIPYKFSPSINCNTIGF